MSKYRDPLQAASWVTKEFGITMRDNGSPVGLGLQQLIAIALRRNPRRAQLLVSTVLGKHLAADPRVIVGVGRLLGALVDRTLAGEDEPVPASWTAAAQHTVSGERPDALIELLDSVPPVATGGILTLGFAETATSLGHLVADQLRSAYLHSTRRRDGPVPVAADFTEPHSHATGHLLRPEPAHLLVGDGPVVLVDDELSTGRTALNVIEALQAVAPRARYVFAGLVDVRSEYDDTVRAAVAERLNCRIDVVSLVRGEIVLPTGILDRIAAELGGPGSDRSGRDRRLATTGQDSLIPHHSRLDLPWPVDLPSGGRHGFLPADRPAFDSAVRHAARALTAAAGSATRVLVLGTEELMYLPLRLALELVKNPLCQIVFQSTTRSPVHAIDRPGYPIRRRIDFHTTDGDGAVSGDDLDHLDSDHGLVLRHLYHADWPSVSGESTEHEPDLIVVVDDGFVVPGPSGIADSIAAATGTPVLLAVLSPRPTR